jgi:cytochrome c biogenesis protein CcmG/thiol:disulfide interchange protein DsbE
MNWRRAGIAASLTIPIVALFGYGLTKDPHEIPSPLPGHAAPPFALSVFAPGQPPLNRAVGDTIRLADLRGRVVVLNFWASWCLACRDEHVGLTAVAREYASQPVTFVGSLYQDAAENGTAWITQMGGQSYPSVQDPGSHTAIDYGLYGVPETFVIAPNGQIARKITGPATPGAVRQMIDSLLATIPGAGSP